MKKPEQKQNKRRTNSQIPSVQKLPPLGSKQTQIPPNFSLSACSYQEEGLIGVLHEYFMKHHYLETLQAFQRDCLKSSKVPPHFEENLKTELMKHFDQNQRELFMAKFSQFVPLSLRSKDLQTTRIEFYIQLYFFLYSVHPQLGKKRQVDPAAKAAFTAYLEGRGAALAKVSQFLQYYALAYLPKPQDNPAFKAIFKHEWIVQLRTRVVFFIEKLYPSGKTPLLVNMYDRYVDSHIEKASNMNLTQPDEEIQIEEQIQAEQNVSPVLHEREQEKPKLHTGDFKVEKTVFDEDFKTEEVQSLREKVTELEDARTELVNYIESIRGKHQNLQNEFNVFATETQNSIMESQIKWFKITQEIYNLADSLLGVCRKFQTGVPLDDPDIVQKIGSKLGKFNNFMHLNVEELFSDDNIELSLFERPNRENSTDLAIRQNDHLRGHKFIEISSEKVRACLQQSESGLDKIDAEKIILEKCLLLQAFRWRVTKTWGIYPKREAVVSITFNDVLGLTRNDGTIEQLLSLNHQKVTQEALLLIGAMMKDHVGRIYLCCKPLIVSITRLLKNEKASENIKNLAYICLQWSSTRIEPPKYMVEEDIILLIVRKLDKERETMPNNVMLYVSALLLNILLNKNAKQKCIQIKAELLMTLINMMECEEFKVRQFVNGALYPLFGIKELRDQAKQFGMEENIKYLLENNPSPEVVHQLTYISKRLQLEEDPVEPENEEDGDEDEVNDEEIGEEEDFMVEQIGGPINGEELLMKNYLLIGPQLITQAKQMREKVQESLKNSVPLQNSVYERQSTANNSILGRVIRNVSQNNSTYSNSNRGLKSEMNSRSQVKKERREKLDTVHQNGSEISIKDFDDRKNDFVREEQVGFSQQILPNVRDQLKEGHYILGTGKVEELEQSREVKKSQAEMEQAKTQEAEEIVALGNISSEAVNQYKKAFIPKARLVRTPPRR